jgi:photosystem II stability/assembly factor-like uncharacterized protein
MDAVPGSLLLILTRVCVMGLLCPLFTVAVQAEPSLIMPKARQSLLLDITNTGQRLLAVGERGHVLLQDSPRDEWQQVSVPVQRMLTALCFSDSVRGWAVGYDGVVLATVDGGKSWHTQYLGLTYQFALNQQLLSDLIMKKRSLEAALATGEDDDIKRDVVSQLEELALDIEDAQAALAEPPYTPPLLDVYCRDSLTGYAVGAFGIFLSTRDGGVNWLREDNRIPNPGQYHLNAITGNGDGKLWIVGESGLMFYSANDGRNWQPLDSPYEGSLFGIEYQSERNTLLAFGLRGNAFLSSDGGVKWTKSHTVGDRAFSGGAWFNADYVMLVGSVGNAQLSRDGGLNFQVVSFPGRANLSAVAVRNGRATAVGLGGIYPIDELGEP